jgi:nicotinamidase-related amidase
MSPSGGFSGDFAADDSVLLVVDKQRFYTDPSLSPFFRGHVDPPWCATAVRTQDALIAAARSSGVPVVWALTVEGPPYGSPSNHWRWHNDPDEPRLGPGDLGYEVDGEQPRPEEAVVQKQYPDAFTSPGLQAAVAACSRRNVVIIGGYAGRCVLATAFGANVHGYGVVVPQGLVVPHPSYRDEELTAYNVAHTMLGSVPDGGKVLSQWGRSNSTK